jgi:hypothetical protein
MVAEMKNAVASMGRKKASGEDGITIEIYKSTVEILPRFITAIYNGASGVELFHRGGKKLK